MSGLCKDCKWWFPIKNEMDVKSRYETRSKVGRGVCELASPRAEFPDYSDNYLPEHSESLSEAASWDEYIAWLITAPDFGCNQFEAKS